MRQQTSHFLLLLAFPLLVLSQVPPVVPPVVPPAAVPTLPQQPPTTVPTTVPVQVSPPTVPRATTSPLLPTTATTTSPSAKVPTTKSATLPTTSYTLPAVAPAVPVPVPPVAAPVQNYEAEAVAAEAAASAAGIRGTRVWATVTIAGVPTAVPSFFTQSFTQLYGDVEVPKSGSIGMGTQTGQIGVVRTSYSGAGTRVVGGWDRRGVAVALGAGVAGVVGAGQVVF